MVALGLGVLGEGVVVRVSEGAGDEAGMDRSVVLPLSGRAEVICGGGTAAAPECAVSPLGRFGAPDDAGRTAPVEFAGPTSGRFALPVSTVGDAGTEVLDVELPAPAGAGESV